MQLKISTFSFSHLKKVKDWQVGLLSFQLNWNDHLLKMSNIQSKINNLELMKGDLGQLFAYAYKDMKLWDIPLTPILSVRTISQFQPGFIDGAPPLIVQISTYTKIQIRLTRVGDGSSRYPWILSILSMFFTVKVLLLLCHTVYSLLGGRGGGWS